MSFIKLLKETSETKISEAIKTGDAEEVLRDAGYKIKYITPTSFGTQITLARKYPEDEILDLLSDFNVKIKGANLFID